MSKKFLKLSINLIFLIGMSTISAQSLIQIVATPVDDDSSIMLNASSDFNASYNLPVGLRNIGTICASDSAVCSFLMRHKAINGGALLWVPKERYVTYFNSSKGNVTSSLWLSEGGQIKNNNDVDGQVLYEIPGIYNMPTLKVFSSNDEQDSYTAPFTVKSGGTVELALADTREWFSTYYWGANQYEDGGGYLGGTNNHDIVGCGNLYMIGQDEAYLTGVNVYLYKKPTKYASDAKINVRVWLPLITEDSMTLTYLPLEGGYINMCDFKDGTDNEWAPVEGGAAGHIVFSEPIDLYGKPYFFISVEGFSDDPSTEDFILLQDLMGKTLSETEAASLLSHNSFVRMNNEYDYVHPISQVGGGTGSFLICPIIKADNTDDSYVPPVDIEPKNNSIMISNNSISVNTDKNGTIDIFSITGVNLCHYTLQMGRNNISIEDLSSGIYFIKTSNGERLKFYKH